MQPQAPPEPAGTQAEPVRAALAVQETQAPPPLPHAVAERPSVQAPDWQQPPLQSVWCMSPQAVSQARVERLHAVPAGQSAAEVQPQVRPLAVGRQAAPIGLPAQVAQSGWPRAQAPFASPVAQVSLAPSQQPPLQGWAPSQAEPQAPFRQASPAGQSAAAKQPQVAPLAPTTQRGPAALWVQSTQAAPARPQAVSETRAHWLVALQQKPVPQDAPPVPPTAQVDEQVPATQVGVPPPQGTQARPSLPQDAFSVPAMHCLPSQQPPWQAPWPSPQAVSQARVARLHDLPTGQSPGAAQPQVGAPPSTGMQAVPSADIVQSTQSAPRPQLEVVPAQPARSGAGVRSPPRSTPESPIVGPPSLPTAPARSCAPGPPSPPDHFAVPPQPAASASNQGANSRRRRACMVTSRRKRIDDDITGARRVGGRSRRHGQ